MYVYPDLIERERKERIYFHNFFRIVISILSFSYARAYFS